MSERGAEPVARYNAGRFSIDILYEDNHLLVVRKPPNMPVQADASRDLDLQSALKEYIRQKYAKPGNVFLGLCHRLDRPVGGLMVLCRTSKSAERMTRQFADRTVDKRYLCVARGDISAELRLEDWLRKGADGMVRITGPDEPDSKRALLTAEPLARKSGLTLLRVKLYTGRAHQIRVQMSHAGHPLWGDNRYGDGAPGQQIALWSAYLSFEHPTQRQRLEFSCPPPRIEPWSAWSEGDLLNMCAPS